MLRACPVLREDYSGCLQQLMHFPAVSDVTIFMKQAIHLRRNPTAGAGTEIRHRNAIRDGREEEWIQREKMREQACQQELDRLQRQQQAKEALKNEGGGVVGKIRSRVTTVVQSTAAGL